MRVLTCSRFRKGKKDEAGALNTIMCTKHQRCKAEFLEVYHSQSLDPTTPISNVYIPVETVMRQEPKTLQEQGWAALHHIVYSVD